jgi:hypothetical protein
VAAIRVFLPTFCERRKKIELLRETEKRLKSKIERERDKTKAREI